MVRRSPGSALTVRVRLAARWRQFRPAVFAFLAGPLVLLIAGVSYQSLSAADDQRRFPPPGRRVDVGGYRLHIDCSGPRAAGVPTVVFEGGLGAPGLLWALVRPGVAAHARACSYDRAGYGWSDPGPQPRTARQMTGELHVLLQQAHEPPPYVLVGHSFGGIVVRLFAAEYPAEVAGLILVDARHEDFFQRMPPASLRADENNLRSAQLLRFVTPLGITRLSGNLGRLDASLAYLEPLPQTVKDAVRAVMIYNPQHWATAVAEREAITASYEQVRAARLPDALPLTVLSAEYGADAWQPPDQPPDDTGPAIWMELQQQLARLSTRSQWIVVARSGHYVYLDRPDAVIDAVLAMLADARR
jgi:pimeloyl-ACP methyl ester carboxylesterase